MFLFGIILKDGIRKCVPWTGYYYHPRGNNKNQSSWRTVTVCADTLCTNTHRKRKWCWNRRSGTRFPWQLLRVHLFLILTVLWWQYPKESPPLTPMVPLFCNTDGIHIKCDANNADKWNFWRICTDKNGMRSLPHGASHGEWKIYAKSVCLTP